MDIGLVAAVKKAVGAKPRRHITPAIMLAFIGQESSGNPIFVDTKPGSLFSMNVIDAVNHRIRDSKGKVLRIVNTGLTPEEVRRWTTLPIEINGWRVPSIYAGKHAKFRFEYGYWMDPDIRHLPKEQRFRMACSWGCVQFMGPNIVGRMKGTDAEKDAFIQRFAADVALQLLYAAGMIDDLLYAADGDVNRAYRGYNSGNIHSTRPDVCARAASVAMAAAQIAKQLKV